MKLLIQILLVLITSPAIGQIAKPIIHGDSVEKYVYKYPAEARKQGIEGTVEIKVTFDSNCNIKDYKVIKSLGYGCDESAVSSLVVFQQWVRKDKNGKCEEGLEMIYPVKFSLAK